MGTTRIGRAMVAAGFFGALGNASAEPVPMPVIPIAVSEPRPVPDVVPVAAPLILPGSIPAPEKTPAIVAPSIAPPSELSTPSLPAMTLPPTAPTEFPKSEAPPVLVLPKPDLTPLAPIAPPTAPVVIPGAETPVKPELKLPPQNPGYNSTPEKFGTREAAPPPALTTSTPTAPGEDTVKSKTVTAIKAAVVGTIMATAPAAAEEPKVVPPAAEVKTFDAELKAQIATLKDDIKTLKEKQSTYNDLIAGRADGKVVTPLDAGLMKRVDNLEAGLKKIEDRLKSIDDKLSSTTAAASPLAGAGGAALVAGKSKVRLVNEYAVRISIVVNGTSHQLDAKQMKDLEVPAGSFNYQLLADGADKVSSNIKEGETVTLRIR